MDNIIEGISNFITQREACDIAQELPFKTKDYHQQLLTFVASIKVLAPEELGRHLIFKNASYFITHLPGNNKINQAQKIRAQLEILDCLYASYDQYIGADPWLSVETNDNKSEAVPLQDPDKAMMVLKAAFEQWQNRCLETLTSGELDLKKRLKKYCDETDSSWISLCFFCDPSQQEPYRRRLINNMLSRATNQRPTFIEPPVIVSQQPSSQKKKRPSAMLSANTVDDCTDDESDLTFTTLVNNAAKSFSELFFLQKETPQYEDDEEACRFKTDVKRPHPI